jgi:hypothetical protein
LKGGITAPVSRFGAANTSAKSTCRVASPERMKKGRGQRVH